MTQTSFSDSSVVNPPKALVGALLCLLRVSTIDLQMTIRVMDAHFASAVRKIC
jgi:hypothetical protein